jgi:DNA-binding response OmpR family regulator
MEPRRSVVLLGVEWRPRALVRAQLIEEGFDVVATDSWPEARRFLRPGMKPDLVLVDLQGLPDPERVLADLRVLMKPNRVLVLSAASTLPVEEVEAFGFHLVKRPVPIERIVDAVKEIMSLG